MMKVKCLIAELSGKSGKFSSLRIQFKAKLYVGKLTLAERQQLLSEMEARGRSRESVMVELGFDDPATEIERIKNDPLTKSLDGAHSNNKSQ